MSLTLGEARDLGAALGSDFFILGDAQTLRRSPSNGPVYFDSYASIFVVSARTGRLSQLAAAGLRGRHTGGSRTIAAFRVIWF